MNPSIVVDVDGSDTVLNSARTAARPAASVQADPMGVAALTARSMRGSPKSPAAGGVWSPQAQAAGVAEEICAELGAPR